jgi:hypothetical protein
MPWKALAKVRSSILQKQEAPCISTIHLEEKKKEEVTSDE